MQIIDIHANQSPTPLPQVSDKLKELYGIECHGVDASALSAFTALNIATKLKDVPAEAIICHRRKDLVAAIDSLRLRGIKKGSVKIIYAPADEKSLDEKLTSATLKATDIIVVPTKADTLNQNFSGANIIVIEPTAPLGEETPVSVPQTGHSHLNITWLGPINEYQRLQNLVNAVHALGPDFHINVYGTGPARTTMPIVKGSRYMDGLNITWHGEEFDTDTAIADSDIAVATTRIPSQQDIRLRACSVPVLNSENQDALISELSGIQKDRSILATLKKQARTEYETRFALSFHVEQWMKLLSSIRQ